jgi:hypothetical protein
MKRSKEVDIYISRTQSRKPDPFSENFAVYSALTYLRLRRR